MDSISERDEMIQELLRLEIANKLMDEEMIRLQPDLEKYADVVHPAARPVQPETVSTSSLDEKTKGIKQETSNLKVVENNLATLNKQVATIFNEVASNVSHRESLLSEIEEATAQMSSLTIGISHFEVDSDEVRNAVESDSSQLKSLASIFQERLQEKISKLAELKKTAYDLDISCRDSEARIKILHARIAELASKIDLDSLAQLKGKLAEMTGKTVTLNEYLAEVTKDEGERMESLTAAITECEKMKKENEDLSKQQEELDSREKETFVEMKEKTKQVEELQMKLTQLKAKKELVSKNYEIAMTELKERTDPLIESLKSKKETAGREHEDMKKRMANREECLRLRMELEAVGNVQKLDLSREMEALKKEIEDTRANIAKIISETEYYRSAAAKFNAEADEMRLAERKRKEAEEKKLHEKDRVATHYEREVFLMKKKMEEERIEKEDRLAQATRRLLEKAKEEKARKEKEEKRRVDREKEKKRKAKEEEEKKVKRAKEEEEKKAKRAKEEEEKKAKRAKEEEDKLRAKEEEEKKLKRAKDEEEKKLKRAKDEEEKKLKRAKDEEEKKLKRAKDEEEKKLKRAKDEEEKKKRDEAKNQVKKEAPYVSRVQQRRMVMEAAAAVPAAYKDAAVVKPSSKPPVAHAAPVSTHMRPRSSIPMNLLFVYDGDTSEDDDDDMDDFLDGMPPRVMPKIPEKYAGSPPRVDKQITPRNDLDLSFTDAQSSTPVRTENNPAPAFELSFNEVVTSTPQIQKASKTDKKQTRARGKKSK